MAQIRETRLVDDLDGGQADETVQFHVDGKPREIDLNADNAARLRERLREAVAPYVEASRPPTAPAGRRRSSSASSGSRPSAGERARNRAIREWGRRKGHEVSDRGRLGDDVVEAHARAGYPATSGSEHGEPSAEYAPRPAAAQPAEPVERAEPAPAMAGAPA